MANKPILFYGIESICDAGIKDIAIIVGDTADEVMHAVGDGSRFGARIHYIRQEAPLGLAHAVKISRDFMKDDPFVMYLGDNLLSGGIRGFVDEFTRGKYDAQILLTRVKNPGDFGVAELKGDRVVGLEEKPKHPKSDYALVGVYMFTPSIFEATDRIKPSWRNELEITDAIQYLIEHGRNVRSHVIKGWWKDTGKLEDLLEANRMALTAIDRDLRGSVDAKTRVIGEVSVGEGAVVESSELRGPLVIGPRTVVRDSYVGPFTSISSGCTIVGSEVEFSIILEDSRIENLTTRMEGSLVGRNARITQAPAKPRAFRFMVGDNSEIQVPE